MGKAKIGKLQDKIVKDIDELAANLQKFLIEGGVKPEDSKLTSLVKAFERLLVIAPQKEYHHFITNKDGFIIDVETFGAVIEKDGELPPDIFRGYYKIVEGKLVLDEAQRRKLWEVL